MTQQGRIFGAEVRRRYNLLLGLATFAAGLLPFALGLVIVELLWPTESDPLAILVAATALLVSPLATWMAHNRLGLAGNSSFRRRLRERIEQEEWSFPSEVRPIFVGFSPGEEQLIWDGDTDRDIGFLAAWGDALVYRGDDFEWHLPRDRIDIIEPMQPLAGVNRILVRWHAPRESNRSFTLVSREANDLRGAREATGQLLQQLYAWVSSPPAEDAEVPKLGMPPTDLDGGRPADAAPGGSCAVTVALTAAMMVGAWQVGRPMIEAGRYAHALLAAGCVFVAGGALVNGALRLLQWAEERDAADAGS
ncbi:MAG: hypothetical protein GX131_10640 [candidate division WS1 bacterium]|jgi:hypothetical protein|nr:hypothetical protein [candidate division WS1 bacterium]